MNQEDIRRIRKRIDPGLENFRSIYGCYVNGAGEIVTSMEIPVLDMDAEEREMYAALLKKVLSGRAERNLIDIDFTPDQVENSDEHRLLMALKESQLRDGGMRNLLYERIIEHLDMDGDGYVIVLASEVYDLGSRYKKDGEWSEESTSQFGYFLCSICPVKTSRAALQYNASEQEFRGISTGSVLAAPVLGFMFPVLNDGAADIYQVQYYSRSAADIHDDLIGGLFASERMPMAADIQKDTFNQTLSEALGKECSLDVVSALQAKMAAKAEDNEAEKSRELPRIAVEDVEEILAGKGISSDHIREFREAIGERFDGAGTFNINNLISRKKFEVQTPETKITTEPINGVRLKTRTIDGVTYILVPIGESITVNGVEVVVDYGEEK